MIILDKKMIKKNLFYTFSKTLKVLRGWPFCYLLLAPTLDFCCFSISLSMALVLIESL